MQLSSDEIRTLFTGKFATALQDVWPEWQRNYTDQLEAVATADEATWMTPAFQQRLWESRAVANIGPGQAVTVVGAYTDEHVARVLWEARGSLVGLATEQRGQRLQALFDEVLALV